MDGDSDESAVRESERMYRSLAENATDMISRHDPRGVYIYASPACRTLLGYEPEELVGHSAYEFIHPDDLSQINSTHSSVLERSETQLSTYRVRRKDGHYVWFETNTRTVLNPAPGEAIEIQCSSRDVTARVDAEEALRQSEEEFRGAFEVAAIGMGTAMTDGRWVRVNRALCELLGYSEAEMLGGTIREITYPDDLEFSQGQIRRLLAGQIGSYQLEKRYIHKRGHVVWARLSVSLIRDAEGKPFHLVGLIEDITPRKRAEEALRASEARFRAVAETAHDAIVSADGRGTITHFNRGAERMFGQWAADVVGGPLTVLMPEGFQEAHRIGLARFLSTGEARVVGKSIELVGRRKDGAEFPMELSLARWETDEGTFFTGIIRDITERRRAEELLRLQNARLEEAALAERSANEELKRTQSRLVESTKMAGLGQMVAGVAHEINNPLAFVSSNVAVLQRDLSELRELLALYEQAEGVLAEAAPDLLARIRELRERVDMEYTLENLPGLLARTREGHLRIQQIVKDLRSFARLDEGDLGEADLNAGIESTVTIIMGHAKKKGVAIELDLRPLPRVTCYAAKINQVVMNLMTNGIDACADGGRVTIRTAVDAQGVRIEVADDGQGIDPAIRDRIFDPFFTTKPIGVGTGLGLSISYGIIQDHGGRIDVESTPGQGTRFIVLLPVKPDDHR